jgi:exodeoxyribonuclease V alpha subunit
MRDNVMTITLQGIVIDLSYQNEDTGYTVLHLQTATEARTVTCAGVMPTVSKGESVRLQGTFEVHRRFGRQFKVERYEIVRPTTIDGILRYLSSGLIVSVGPTRAKLMVARFGLKTLNILDNEPDSLGEVYGIGPKTLEKIKSSWQRQRHLRDLMLFLQEIGVTVNGALKIYKVYGPAAREKISADPYALINDVWGIGFKKADCIAQKMGFKHDSYKRIRAGMQYVLDNAASSEGHCFLPVTALIVQATQLLAVSEELVIYTLDHTASADIFIREDDRVYLPPYHQAEKSAATFLRKRIGDIHRQDVAAMEHLRRWLAAYESRTGFHADDLQAEAIVSAAAHPLFLLTGGPGTGKTAILQVLVSYFSERGNSVALAAPTGRAAVRLGTVAGCAARTIHRLLEFNGQPGGGSRFMRNEQNPIEADVLIIDEMSMVDILLMRNLLAAVAPATALVMVGDNNQLPSVGPGNVLSDLIASGRIPHVHLTKIFRQAAQSRIVTAAHEIMNGTIPHFSNSPSDNCFFITQGNPEACVDTIVDLVTRRLPGRYAFDPVADIQVLSPMHRGPLGTMNLTARLQRELATSPERISRGAVEIILGDKVLQIRNNYDLGVFNGDVGIVTAIDEDEGVTVDFDGNIVQYSAKELDELIPAYCMSIHKSQGSEFKAVVIPLSTQHFILLQRNLLYTALTRARRLCVFVGTRKALSIAVANNKAIFRYSSLAERLRAVPETGQ